jgi:hypothetical protein
VSIARTTPAQKPRGEHSNTLSGGFSEAGAGVMVRTLRGERPTAGLPAPRPQRLCPSMWAFARAPVKHVGSGR